MDKMGYTHTPEYYSSIKRNGVLIHTPTCINLRNLKKRSVTEDHKQYSSIYRKCPELAQPWTQNATEYFSRHRAHGDKGEEHGY